MTGVRGEGDGGLVQNVDGLSSVNWQLQNSHGVGDGDYRIGNTVNNIVITMYGAKWVPEASGGPPYKVHYFLTTMLYI